MTAPGAKKNRHLGQHDRIVIEMPDNHASKSAARSAVMLPGLK
jgi:hypothetical protein